MVLNINFFFSLMVSLIVSFCSSIRFSFIYFEITLGMCKFRISVTFVVLQLDIYFFNFYFFQLQLMSNIILVSDV